MRTRNQKSINFSVINSTSLFLLLSPIFCDQASSSGHIWSSVCFTFAFIGVPVASQLGLQTLTNTTNPVGWHFLRILCIAMINNNFYPLHAIYPLFLPLCKTRLWWPKPHKLFPSQYTCKLNIKMRTICICVQLSLCLASTDQFTIGLFLLPHCSGVVDQCHHCSGCCRVQVHSAEYWWGSAAGLIDNTELFVSRRYKQSVQIEMCI